MKTSIEKKVMTMLSFHSFKCFLYLLFPLLKDESMIPATWWKVREWIIDAGLRSNHSITSMIQFTLLKNKKQTKKDTFIFNIQISHLISCSIEVRLCLISVTYKNQMNFLSLEMEVLLSRHLPESTGNILSPPSSLKLKYTFLPLQNTLKLFRHL